MSRRVGIAAVCLLLLASPFLVSAQNVTSCSENSLICILQGFLESIEQELQQIFRGPSSTIVTTQNGEFSASPTSGRAPLTVTFTAPNDIGGGYFITYGDGGIGGLNCTEYDDNVSCTNNGGTGGVLGSVSCDANAETGACLAYNVQHTYTRSGTYTATLNPPVPQGDPGAVCTADGCPPPPPIATLTIHVTGE